MRERNTFAKRQRETGKKQKAADKRARREKRRESANDPQPAVEDRPAEQHEELR